jgi:hypothetical protein
MFSFFFVLDKGKSTSTPSENILADAVAQLVKPIIQSLFVGEHLFEQS